MKEYRIYTEDRPNLPGIVSKRFEGFTILRGEGYWRGSPEPCAVVVILTQEFTGYDSSTLQKLQALCLDIKLENTQEVVILTEFDVKMRILTSDGWGIQ